MVVRATALLTEDRQVTETEAETRRAQVDPPFLSEACSRGHHLLPDLCHQDCSPGRYLLRPSLQAGQGGRLVAVAVAEAAEDQGDLAPHRDWREPLTGQL